MISMISIVSAFIAFVIFRYCWVEEFWDKAEQKAKD